jgi:hypothetical protein
MVDLKKFNIKVLSKKVSKRFVQTEISFKKLNGKFDIGSQDIEDILDGIEEEAEKKNEKIQIMIRGLRIDKYSTLKTFTTHLDDYLRDDDDYYDGKVSQSEKFSKFNQVTFIIQKQKNILN